MVPTNLEKLINSEGITFYFTKHFAGRPAPPEVAAHYAVDHPTTTADKGNSGYAPNAGWQTP